MRNWRPFTWVIIVINALFLIWMLGALASASGDATNCGTLDQATCNDARNAGVGIAVFVIAAFWAFADVILGVIWLITRKREPVVIMQTAQPAAWMPDPWQPGQLRFWDGTTWTGHTHQPTTAA